MYCDFGENLSNCIRDQLVWGLHNRRIQRRLLAEPRLTLEKAIEISSALEAAERDAENINPNKSTHSSAEAAVNFMAKKRKQGSQRTQVKCFRCGKVNHKAHECRFKGFTCHGCGRKGHLV